MLQNYKDTLSLLSSNPKQSNPRSRRLAHCSGTATVNKAHTGVGVSSPLLSPDHPQNCFVPDAEIWPIC